MHLILLRDVSLDNMKKFATVYPAIYCRKPDLIR